MFRTTLLRGVSAGAFAVASSALVAQEALPTIDIGVSTRPSPGTAGPLLDTQPRQEGYIVQTTTTGTKDNTPIMQSPVSVQVVPRAVIEDQKVTRVLEALENVAGVIPNQSVGGGTGFIVRGFSDNRKLFRNGLLATSPSSFRSEFDAANVDRIEVLKGPAAMLYGRMEPGGIINVVTKRPQDAPFYAVEQRFGSFDHYRTSWDATGPVYEDGSLLYRFSGSYENSGSFRDFVRVDRMLFNPSLTFRLTPDTDFTVDLEFLDQDYKADFGIPSWGTRPADIPINRSLRSPSDPLDNIRKFHLGSELTHRFNEHFTFRNRFLASFTHTNDDVIQPHIAAAPILSSDGTMRRMFFGQVADADVYTTNFDLLGHFDLLGAKHDTLIGFDYLRSETQYSTYGATRTVDPAFNINIFYPWPGYWIPTALFEAAHYVRSSPSTDRSVYHEDQKGAYFQDHITILDKLHIFGGGRYDWSEIARGRGPTLDAARANVIYAFPSVMRKDDAFSPRVGVLVQPYPWISLYGSWTQSFGLNNGVDRNQLPLAPQQAEQIEAGVKTELFDQRLTATLALYELGKTNIPTRDWTSPDPQARVLIGKERSRGVEFQALGKVTDNVSLTSSFTYMDARVAKDNTLDARGLPQFQGKRLPNAPRYQGSIWVKWDIKEIEALDGFSLGFGAFVVGNRQGDRFSNFQLPGYVRFDAMAAYRWNVGASKVIASFNVRNLTNTKYYSTTDSGNVNPLYGIFPGAPLTAIGSIRVEF